MASSARTICERRVVVTGLGALCPIGNTVEDAWRAALNGRSGVAPVSRFDADGFSVRIAGEVRGFNPDDYLPPKAARHMDLFIHYGFAAGAQAVKDAGLENGAPDPRRAGVAFGSGIGGLRMIDHVANIYRDNGPRKISPFFVPATIINMISGHLSIKYGFMGPNIALVSACTTGAHNIGDAFRIVARGDADIMVCGGAEAAITPLGLGSFAAARALSSRNDSPQEASRPFDCGRDGFVLGEGAAALVLEEYESATKRGARIYAEIAGYGMSGDAHHMTAPREDGEGARSCMEHALRDARVNADEVDHINAHGTSTPLGDKAEAKAICAALGEHSERPAVSATKSMTGHLLGAAGGVEAVFSVLAIAESAVPPTINLDDPDPECPLNHVAGQAREMEVNVAISNSFGFGGANASILFRKV